MMQPAPLAGSETRPSFPALLRKKDATRAPRGVGNVFSNGLRCSKTMQPAPLAGSETRQRGWHRRGSGCNPRPSGGRKLRTGRKYAGETAMQPAPLAGSETSLPFSKSWLSGCNPRPSRGRKPKNINAYFEPFIDATRAPRGVGNDIGIKPVISAYRCNPRPSLGRKPARFDFAARILDATRAPHGVGNSSSYPLIKAWRMQPAPLAGSETLVIVEVEHVRSRCNPRPSRGRKQIPS